MVEPIRGQNLTQSIVQSLGRAIVAGEYSSHDPFPIEAGLCEQYDASRSAVREAVKMLTAKGLLSARPRQGTRVEPESNWNLLDPDVLQWFLQRQFSTALITEFTQVRLAIEPEAAALAAQAAIPEGIAALRAAIDRMEDAGLGLDDALDSDVAFHIALLRASGNRFYAKLTEFSETALRFSIPLTNRLKGVEFANVEEHIAILNAIEGGNAALARKRTRALIEAVLALVEVKGGQVVERARLRKRRS